MWYWRPLVCLKLSIGTNVFPFPRVCSFVFPALSVDHLLDSGLQGCAMKCLSTEILRVESKPKKETVLSQEVFLGSISLSCIKTKLHILKFAILLHLTIYYRGYCLEMSRWISVWWVTAMLKKKQSHNLCSLTCLIICQKAVIYVSLLGFGGFGFILSHRGCFELIFARSWVEIDNTDKPCKSLLEMVGLNLKSWC